MSDRYEIQVEEFGDDGRRELKIVRKGKVIEDHCDGGEPEDNYYFRDWKWVAKALEDAYQFGLEDWRYTHE